MAINLEVSLEMIATANGSTSSARANVLMSQISLNPSDYDGATYYFEIVATNTRSNADYAVYLKQGSNTMATITVNRSTTKARLRSSSFSPTSGNNTYTIGFAAAGSNYVQVFSARIIVVQNGATKTRLQIPLLSGASDKTAVTSDSPSTTNCVTDTTATSFEDAAAYKQAWWKYVSANYNPAISNNVCFEAVMASASGGTGYIDIFDTSDAEVGMGSANGISSSATTYTLVTSGQVTPSTNAFANNSIYKVKVKTSSGSYGAYCANAFLYIYLTSMTKAEVLLWIGYGINAKTTDTGVAGPNCRVLVDKSNMSNPVFKYVAPGSCADNAVRMYLADLGTADNAGTETNLGSGINYNSSTKAYKEETGLTLTDDDRFYSNEITSTASKTIAPQFLSISISPPEVPVAGASGATSSVSGVLSVEKKLIGSSASVSTVTGVLTNKRPIAGVIGATSGVSGVLTKLVNLACGGAASPNKLPLDVANGCEDGDIGNFNQNCATASTEAPKSGSYSVKLTLTGGSYFYINSADYIPVTVGNNYVVSAYGRTVTGSLSGMGIRIKWYNSSKSDIGQSDWSSAFGTTTSYSRGTATGQAPTGAAYAGLEVNMYGSGSYYADEFQFENGTTASDYQDPGGGSGPCCTGVSSVSGILTISKKLISNVTAQSTITGTLTNKRPIAGALTAQSDVSAVLKVSKSLIGTSGSSATTSGSLTVTRIINLAGSVTASSGSDGVLKVSKSLISSSDALSTATGSLAVSKKFTGVITALSVVSGQLKIAVKLDGLSASVSNVPNAVLKVDKKLISSSTGISGVTGTLTNKRPISASSGALSGVTGVLKISKPLISSVEASSGVTGSLTVERNLTPLVSSSDAISSVSGVLKVNRAIISSSNGLSGVTGVLKVNKNIIASVDGLSSVSGALKVDKKLTASVTALSDVAGSLTVDKGPSMLNGGLSAVSGVNGSLSVFKPLISSSTGISAVSGTLVNKRPIAGSVTSSSGTTAELEVSKSLIGLITANSTSIGSLQISKKLISSITANSTITGTLTNIRPLTSNVTAISEVTGSLNIISKLIGSVTSSSSLNGILIVNKSLIGLISSESNFNGYLTVGGAFKGSVSAISQVTGRLGVFKYIKQLQTTETIKQPSITATIKATERNTIIPLKTSEPNIKLYK